MLSCARWRDKAPGGYTTRRGCHRDATGDHVNLALGHEAASVIAQGFSRYLAKSLRDHETR